MVWLVGVGAGSGTDDATNIGNIVGCDGHITINGEVLHRAKADFAEEACTGAVRVDIQTGDGISLTVKVATEIVVGFAGGTDGGPGFVFQIDIRGQFGIGSSVHGIDMFGKPEEVAAVGDLIIAVLQHCGLIAVAAGAEAVGAILAGMVQPTASSADAFIVVAMVSIDGIEGGIAADGNAVAGLISSRSGGFPCRPSQEVTLGGVGAAATGDRHTDIPLTDRRGACIDVLSACYGRGRAGAAVGIKAYSHIALVHSPVGLRTGHVGGKGRCLLGSTGGIVIPPAQEFEGSSVIGHGIGVRGHLGHLLQMGLHRAGLGRAGAAAGGIQIMIGSGHRCGELLVVQVDTAAAGSLVQIYIGGNIAALAAACINDDLCERGAAGVSGDIGVDITAACIRIQVNRLILTGIGFSAAAQQVCGNAVKSRGIGLILVGAEENTRDRLTGVGSGLIAHVDIMAGAAAALIQVIINNGEAVIPQDILGCAFFCTVGHCDFGNIGRHGGIHSRCLLPGGSTGSGVKVTDLAPFICRAFGALLHAQALGILRGHISLAEGGVPARVIAFAAADRHLLSHRYCLDRYQGQHQCQSQQHTDCLSERISVIHKQNLLGE